MGLEQNIERIADALEKLAAVQAENLAVNRSFRDFLMKKEARKSNVEAVLKEAAASVQDDPVSAYVADMGAPAEASQPVAPLDSAELPQGLTWNGPVPSVQSQPEMTFEELKAALHIRGYDFPKGTKRTTLAKAWEAHKDEPIKPHEPSPVEPPPLCVNPAGYAPSLTEAPAPAPAEAPAPAPAEAPAPAPESVKPLSRDEAAARIRAHYTASPEDREIFKKALVAAGVQENGSFRDVADGKFDILVETYERLKGIANA